MTFPLSWSYDNYGVSCQEAAHHVVAITGSQRTSLNNNWVGTRTWRVSSAGLPISRVHHFMSDWHWLTWSHRISSPFVFVVKGPNNEALIVTGQPGLSLCIRHGMDGDQTLQLLPRVYIPNVPPKHPVQHNRYRPHDWGEQRPAKPSFTNADHVVCTSGYV